MLTLRPFHPDDTMRLAGHQSAWPAFGLTAVRAGEPVGFGGVCYDIEGRCWGFFHSSDAELRRPFTLHRLARRWLATVSAAGVMRIHVLCDDSMPRAEAWLIRLGFRRLRDDERTETIEKTEKTLGQGCWIYVGHGASDYREPRLDRSRDGDGGLRAEGVE